MEFSSMTHSFNDTPRPRFTGLFIPAEILEHEELTLLEQMLLSWIDSLYSPDYGGCFAKNDYLAKKLKVKENTIAKALTNLRRLKLIEDVNFDGRNRVIRALIGRHVDQCQSKAALDLNPTLDWIKIQPSIGQKSNPIYKEYNKEDNKEEREREGASTPPALSSSKESKIQRAPHVATTDSEHQKLIDKLGIAVTEQCYEKLSTWKEDTPKSKWKNSDYRSILRWVIQSLQEENVRNSKASSSSDTSSENRKYAEKIAENFNPVRCKQRGFRIDVLSSAVEIVSTGNSNVPTIQIKFSEKGFEEQLENAMRKRGLH